MNYIKGGGDKKRSGEKGLAHGKGGWTREGRNKFRWV